MATEQGFENHVQQLTATCQYPRSYSNIFLDFLEAVRERTEEDVRCLLPINSNNTRRMDNGDDDEDALSSCLSRKQKLLKALESKDPVEVWKLIAEAKESDVKTLESLNEICQSVAEHERLKEEGLISFLWGNLRGQVRCTCGYGTSGSKYPEDKETQTEFQHEEEQQWIRILSDPLYIGLEWLWRNNPNNRTVPTSTQQTKRKDRKFEDIIETCLDDAYLLEKIALYEHHYSRDEYMNRALEYEKFAADVIEGSNLDQLHEILDVEGSGCLLQKKPVNFNQSLSLLKIAADKERKKFVTSPKCQSVLNEIVYYEWPYWQNMSCLTKMAWFFFQLLFVAVSCIFYIPVRLASKFPSRDKDNSIWWRFREKYEHPYSKFINHTMWYLGFLFFIFSTSFEREFGTTETGLVWLDYPVIVFVLGLLLQESLEARRQGFYIYMSKWWNVVDTLIIVIFLTAYSVWLLAWTYYHRKWMPRKSSFVLADVLYASATVVAYFHLTHIFQVDSVLGPLQLSLYKMLKDVRRFLFIFLVLYISFVTGVVKVYSYYVASQIKLQKLNASYFEESHPYTNHVNASIGLFWMLFGVVEEEKISVQDPDFVLIATFGRLFLMAYMVCTVIVALNMLVAMMNNSFDRIMENADMEWKFSRARMWLEWIDKGNTMPAPLNIVYYILYLVVVEFCGKCLGRIKEKCPCCEGNKDEEMQEVNRKRDEATVRKERRKEIMKDLVVKYLQDRYFGESVAESNMEETGDDTDLKESGGKHPKNIQDNINLLKKLVDRQTKELAELSKKIDSIIK